LRLNCSRSTLDHREAAGQRAVRHRVHPCGAGAGSFYRRHYHPDLSDLDLCAGRPRRHKGYEYGRTHNPTRAALEGTSPPWRAAGCVRVSRRAWPPPAP
jgi:hypothetical protein